MENALLEKKEIVEEFLLKRDGVLSSHSFVNLFSWKGFFRFEFKMIDDCLCIFAQDDNGCFLYLPPLAKQVRPQVLQECFRYMEKVNGPGGVSRIENVSQKMLGLFPRKDFDSFNKGYEYLYYRKDIVDLQGNAYKTKRSDYNHFVRNNDYEFLDFQDSMQEECSKLYDRWAQGRLRICRDDIYTEMIRENRAVHRMVLLSSRRLGLCGKVVKVNGQIQAYTFGYPLSDDHFCIIFEVADVSVKGLPVFVFREFCKSPELERYRFINAMDAIGMINVELAKLSFKPCIMEPVFIITKKDKDR